MKHEDEDDPLTEYCEFCLEAGPMEINWIRTIKYGDMADINGKPIERFKTVLVHPECWKKMKTNYIYAQLKK